MRDWLNDRLGRRKAMVRRADVQTPLRLFIRASHASVSVRGGEGATATVRAEVESTGLRGDDDTRADDLVAAGIVLEGDWLAIESPSVREGLRVHYEVTVPAATLGNIDVSNGPVDVRGIDGPVEITLSNGPLNVEDIGGAVEVELRNGPGRVRDCRGAVDLRVANGPIAVQRVAGPLDVTVSNGPIAIEDAASSVEASATNGPIAYKGAVGGNFAMRSMRGGIALELPEDARFELDAEAERGHVLCEFDVKEASAPSGEPPARIVLRSERGEIVLRQASKVGVA